MLAESRKKLEMFGQQHLLQFADRIEKTRLDSLLGQIAGLDLPYLDSLIKEYVLEKGGIQLPKGIEPPFYFPILPQDAEQSQYYSKAVSEGERLMGQGKVAILTVAGGQGTRLGFDGPKGKYPITPIKRKPLFQYFSERILRASRKFRYNFKWFIMTSKVNHIETRKFFEDNRFFGLNPEDVTFFSQGMMPAFGLDGKILLESQDSLALAPNGHGGTLLALKDSGSLEIMKRLGIEYISYFQIDNPLVSVMDPLFIGLHFLEKSEMSCRSLTKTGPYEKLGNFCVADGRLSIIEYSDMPPELCEKKNEKSELLFRAGSPAIHVFSRDFIERLTLDGRLRLPWHRAEKKVPYVDASGVTVKPDRPNAIKIETFIFDALPLAAKTMILEATREEEFAPVKNPDGVDSAVTCRRMLVEKDASWLRSAGLKIPATPDGVGCTLELSPLAYFDRDDVARRFAGSSITIEPGKEYYFE